MQRRPRRWTCARLRSSDPRPRLFIAARLHRPIRIAVAAAAAGLIYRTIYEATFYGII